MRNFVVFGLGVVVTVAAWACKVRVAESNLQADGTSSAGTCLVPIWPYGVVAQISSTESNDIKCSDDSAKKRFKSASGYSSEATETTRAAALVVNFAKINQAGFQFVSEITFGKENVSYLVFRY